MFACFQPSWLPRPAARGMIASVQVGHPDDQVFVAERQSLAVGCLHILARQTSSAAGMRTSRSLQRAKRPRAPAPDGR
jgi:hypothetical protein